MIRRLLPQRVARYKHAAVCVWYVVPAALIFTLLVVVNPIVLLLTGAGKLAEANINSWDKYCQRYGLLHRARH